MKKEHKLLRQLCFAILPCVAAALLSGCAAGRYREYPNPKVRMVDEAWLEQFAIVGKTKDVDILHKLCNPSSTVQYSNGGKGYVYRARVGSFESDSRPEKSLGYEYWYSKDGSSYNTGSKRISFEFNPDHTLKEVVSGSQHVFTYRYSKITSYKDLFVFLETLPAKATAQVLKKRLGEPSRVLGNRWGYAFTMEYSVMVVWFYLGEGDVVEHMSVPQRFYEYVMKNRIHFNINMVYFSERFPDERELAAIEGCEK